MVDILSRKAHHLNSKNGNDIRALFVDYTKVLNMMNPAVLGTKLADLDVYAQEYVYSYKAF